MKVALITDTHAGAHSDSLIFNDYFLRFYNEVFFPYLDKNNIDTIIHLGDLFDRRKYVNFYTLYSWRKNIFEVLNKNYKTYIIQGNHDIFFKQTNEVTSLREILSPYKNIEIIDSPCTKNIDGTDILMLPWVNEENKEGTEQNMKSTNAQIVMGHLEICGFCMYPGIPNSHADMDPGEFVKFESVFSGHFHHKSSNDNIHYLGSPYEMTWADFGDPKGFHVFDTDTRDIEFVENPLKIYHKYYYNDENKTIDGLAVDLQKYKGTYVKVVVEKKTNTYIFDQFIEAVKNENPVEVSIIDAMYDTDLDDDSIDETKDTLTLLVECVQNSGMDDKDMIPLIDLLKNLFLEAQNIDV